MDLKSIQEIAKVSKRLLALKEDLERYDAEGYLNETKLRTPWITVNISNHPTHLRDFIVYMCDDDLRDSIVKLVMQQIKMSIKKKEKKLRELLKGI